MIQINCNTVNLQSTPVLVLMNGHSHIAERENEFRSIFKLADDEHDQVGDFLCDGQVVVNDYKVPSLPGSYEGPVLEIKPLIQELRTAMDQFILPDGSNYNWKGNIDFMLFKHSLEGQDIDNLLTQRYNAGSRAIATLMMANFIEVFDPRSYGSRFYEHIRPFAKALANRGFYWQPIVGADQQVLNLNFQAHLDSCAAEFNGVINILPSLGNECSKNGIKPLEFTRPNTTNLWSRGSEVGDAAPPRPGWDWKEWHSRRDWPKVLFGNDDAWYVKEGINSDFQQLDRPMPTIVSEPIGFWNHDVPNRRSSDPNLARVIGGTSIYFARGANFMSEAGLHSEMWDSVTYDCAVQFFKGINQ